MRSDERLWRCDCCEQQGHHGNGRKCSSIFTEVIVAPDYDADALELLQTKKKNLRILKVSEPPKTKTQFRQIDGGLLVQSTDLIDASGDASERVEAGFRRAGRR